MIRGQLYNTRNEQPTPTASREINRRLDRRIKQNVGLLEQSRQSNHSNSIRLKRTELSGDRINLSRDRELNSQQNSGLTSDAFNQSMRRVPRRMGSVLSLSRTKQPYPTNRIQAAGSRSSKNIVENLYMLTNNVPQYSERRQQPTQEPYEYDERYNSKHSRNRYEPQQYEKYVERQPQNYPERSPKPYRDRSQDKYRQQGYTTRSPTPTRGSILRTRRSKEGSRIRDNNLNQSRDKNFKHIGSNRDITRKNPDNQIRRLQQKYMQNIYELNSPKTRGGDRRDKGSKQQDRYFRDRGGGKGTYRDDKRDRDGKKQSINSPRTHHYRDRDQKERSRPYQDDRQRQYRHREDRAYQDRIERHYVEQYDPREDQYDQRDGYRNQPNYHRQEAYRERGEPIRSGDSRRKNYKQPSNYSGKNYPYQEQVTSTTAGIKTLPDISKYDSIEDVPLNSIGSHKQVPRHRPVEYLPKHSIKLDRPKEQRPLRRPKQKLRQTPRNPYQQSNIEERWQKNNIKLQERPQQRWDYNKKQKTIQDSVEPGSLPTGSMFLPVQSKRYEPLEWTQQILQKIIIHLQTLNLIADYTKDFKKMYQNVQPWQILIFLTYKKFYIERIKATNTLKLTSTKFSEQSYTENLELKENPFNLPYSKITNEELTKFKETKECFALMIELQAENTKIRNALRGLYNLYIEKSGEHVNMLDCDNFSEEVYKLMLEELEGIAENLEDPELTTLIRVRMGKIIKVGLLIAYLNGKYIKNFPQIILHQDMIKIGKRQTLREDSISHLFLQQFKRVLS